MQRIAVSYSRYRHRQLRTSGHLFERRYRAWLVEADTYFVTLLRYIHLNPVKAGMVATADEYAWSSHRAYLGDEILPWLTIDFGLSLFGSTLESAHSAYRTLMAQQLYSSEDRIFEDAHPDDTRVLGGDHFLANLPTTPFRPKLQLTLEQLAHQVCYRHSISILTLRSTARHHSLARVRAELARLAIDGRVASLHEVGRFLDRSPSALSGLLKRHALSLEPKHVNK